MLRRVAQFAGFVIGLINAIIGVELAAELGPCWVAAIVSADQKPSHRTEAPWVSVIVAI